MNATSRAIAVSLAILLYAWLGTATAFGQVDSTRVSLVRENDPAPDGNGAQDGEFDRFLAPVLNDFGEVAFSAYMDNNWNGLFRADATTVELIARSGQAAPDALGGTTGVFTDFNSGDYAINEAGQVAFINYLKDETGAFLYDGIWIGDGTSLVSVARGDDPAPDGNGVIDRIYRWFFNGAGQVAFAASFSDTAGGLDDNTAVLVGDGSSLVTLAREGQAAPGPGSPVFTGLSGAYPYINDSGQVFLRAGIETSDGRSYSALYLFDGSSVQQIARTQDPTPAGETYRSFPVVHENFNEAGQVPVGTILNTTFEEVFFRGSAAGVTTIVKENESAAPGLDGQPDGTISELPGNQVFIAGNGDLFFPASVSGAASGYTSGIFRANEDARTAIAFRGSPAPTANEFFGGFGLYGANERGQMLFNSTLQDAGGLNTDSVLFLYDSNAGLVEAARTSDTLGLYGFAGPGGYRTDEFNGLNEFGQVAYTYDRGFGSYGIALFDPGDIYPPSVSQLRADPEIPGAGRTVMIEALASEADSGGNLITSAEYRIDEGEWLPMTAVDGAYDEVAEIVEANIGTFDSGEFEVCVRAMDSLGWVSGPECISLTVGAGAPDTLLARCFHTPAYVPVTGEIVTIVAEAVDENGIPVEADTVEIYLDFDRNTPQEAASNVSRTTLEYPPPGSFAYSCVATLGPKQFFSGWKRVGVEDSAVDFPAVPVRISGGMDERVDVVFFYDEDEYTSFDDPAFIEDVGLLIQDGYFTIPFFIRWQRIMNFWIAKAPANSGPNPNDNDPSDGIGCLREAPSNFAEAFAFADVAAIVHRSACRDNAGSPGAFTIEMDLDRLNVVAHESGHRPFGLADEYCCDGGYFTSLEVGSTEEPSPPYPNLFETESDCQLAADDAGVDPDTCRLIDTDADAEKWWLHEPVKGSLDPIQGDLMQGSGCMSIYPSSTCGLFNPYLLIGVNSDPNGLYACTRPVENIYFADTNLDSRVQDSESLWICRTPGDAETAVWENNGEVSDGRPDPTIERNRLGDSERRRMFWFIGECLAGRC